jgi:hypothetical protein
MQSHLWQHKSSGERYAVMFDDLGHICCAVGPLHHSEQQIEPSMVSINSDAELAEAIDQSQDDYNWVCNLEAQP